MLHVILLILKILLSIILGILGVALFLVLLVLFAPIRYKVNIKYKDEAKVLAKISFLVVSVKVSFDQKTKEIYNETKILGIKIGSKKKNKGKASSDFEGSEDLLEDALLAMEDEENEIADASDHNCASEDNVPGIQESANNISNDVKDIVYSIRNDGSFNGLENLEDDAAFSDNIETKDVVNKSKIKRFFEKIKNFTFNIRNNLDKTLNNIHLKLEKLKRKINRIKRFWNMKCTVKARKYLKKYIPGIIKHILPRKVKGYVLFGFGDACKTGEVTGYLSLIPIMYQKNFSIYPDFYEKRIEADLLVKGKIRIGYILRIALKPYIWKCIKVARKI